MSDPIEIKLDQLEEAEEVEELDLPKSVSTSPVNELKCNLNQLTPEQYKQIVKDLVDGKQYKYFDIKYLKDGSIKLQKKKQPSKLQTIAARSSTSQPSHDKIFMTDQQQLYEHVIGLTKEVEKLRTKNKKRKQQISEIFDTYYIEDEEVENEVQEDVDKGENVDEDGEQKPKQPQKPKPLRPLQQVHRSPGCWRSRIKVFK
jgi:hypothetical protein